MAGRAGGAAAARIIGTLSGGRGANGASSLRGGEGGAKVGAVFCGGEEEGGGWREVILLLYADVGLGEPRAFAPVPLAPRRRHIKREEEKK